MNLGMGRRGSGRRLSFSFIFSRMLFGVDDGDDAGFDNGGFAFSFHNVVLL